MQNNYPLKISLKMFYLLNKKNLLYCHWKSNQHLAEALCGQTDLDLLVCDKQAVLCESIFKELQFIKIKPSNVVHFPGVHDWLGFDIETGNLIHIHLHYNLILGEKHIKNYHLTLEDWLLFNCRYQDSVRVPEYEYELVLLIIRTILKKSYSALFKNLVKKCIGKNPNWFPSNFYVEINWLLKHYDITKISSAIIKAGIDIKVSDLITFIDRFNNHRFTVSYLLLFKINISYKLRVFKRLSHFKYLLPRLSLIISALYKKSKKNNKKTTYSRNNFFALVGADGSGKTRLAYDLAKWLNWKLDVRHLYFGIPKDDFLINIIRRIVSAPKKISLIIKNQRFHFLNKILLNLSSCLEPIYWLFIARRRLALYKKALKHKKTGCIIIAERYPLTEFWNMDDPMDGPRIAKRKGLSKFMSKLEFFYYKRIGKPDHVFIIKAGINILRGRKEDLTYETHKKKVEAVNNIVSVDNYSSINGELAYEKVLKNIKSKIWHELLSEQHKQ